MRAYITLGFEVEDEDRLPEIQAEVENALYGKVECNVGDIEISPEDGDEEGDEDF